MSNTVIIPDTPYVLLDSTGTIIKSLYANPQPDIPGVVLISPTDSRLTAFFIPAPITTIVPLDFLERFTQTEQQAIMTAAQTNAQILFWTVQLSSAGIVDTTNPKIITGFDGLVQAGLLTQARATQILDLSQVSPPAIT